MGRGRAKAKQTKVARELKYRSVSTDFSSLEAELRASSRYDDHDIPPAYADLAEAYRDDEDFDDEYDDEEDDERGEGEDDAG
jgi:hypothetical protein